MKNKLSDLNDHLFSQLERLMDCKADGDELAAEIKRSKAVTEIADKVVSNGELALKAAEFNAQHLRDEVKAPKMLTGEGNAGLVD